MTASAPARPEASPEAETRRDSGGDVLTIDDASVRFGDLTAVRNVSLSVPRGVILGIIGPSGAGKTTTIRLLTGGLAPTTGRVRVLGEEPRRFHRRTRERIGYMPQQFTLYPDLTAGENVDFVASLFGLLWLHRRRRVRRVLEIVDLWEARGRRATNLSGGQQRRLELACALVHEPELLFLDEPTAGIDPLLRARIWDELHRLKESGRTLLVTTQYVNEAEECDQVALIAEGQLAALATPDDLRRQATGGDVIEVETARPFDGQVLAGTPLVRSVNQLTAHTFRVVVDEVGAATPSVVAAIDEAGGEVVTAREYRLTFDEVFTELVERNRRRLQEGEDTIEAHDRNEADARALVERELEQRRRDANTTPLDEQAEAVGRARTAPGEETVAADAVAGDAAPADGPRAERVAADSAATESLTADRGDLDARDTDPGNAAAVDPTPEPSAEAPREPADPDHRPLDR
jgi:ABC-2 type transport system ATP-binding protein